jgi:hypothetical protein
MRIAILADLIRRKILEVGYRDRLFDVLAAAGRLAWMRAHPSDRSRQRENLHDCRYSVGKATFGYLLHILLTIRMRRAVKFARTNAIAIMITHQKIQRKFARLERTLPIGVNDHSLSGFRGACAEEFRTILNLDDTHATCSIRLEVFPEAQIRNLDARFGGGGKNGRAFLYRNLNTINRQINCCHDLQPFQSTTTAPNLHTDTQAPHFTHFAASMT